VIKIGQNNNDCKENGKIEAESRCLIIIMISFMVTILLHHSCSCFSSSYEIGVARPCLGIFLASECSEIKNFCQTGRPSDNQLSPC